MSDGQRWYGGLQYAEERPLTEEERVYVRGRVRDLNRNVAAVIGFLLFGLVFIAGGFLQSIFFFVGIVFLAISGKIKDRTEGFSDFAFALRRDAKRGVAVVARGTVGELVIGALVNVGDRDPDPIALDILPESGLVLARNGHAVPHELVVPIKTTSAVPERAAMAANFVRATTRADVFAHQRALSDDELRELERYAPKVAFTMYVLTALLIVTWIALLVSALRGAVEELYPLWGAIPVALVAHSTWRRWRLRRQIAPDLAAAVVVIVRVRDGEELAPPQEFLPHSRILWTSNGAPANWRKVVSAA